MCVQKTQDFQRISRKQISEGWARNSKQACFFRVYYSNCWSIRDIGHVHNKIFTVFLYSIHNLITILIKIKYLEIL